MARFTLVLDASVGVKWFSPEREAYLVQSLAIRDAHVSGEILITVPDLFYYEVTNAIVHKKIFSTDMVNTVASSLFLLDLRTLSIDREVLRVAVNISRQYDISIYDASYIAVARNHNCPLVTANPRHQRQDVGCQVVPIDQWRSL